MEFSAIQEKIANISKKHAKIKTAAFIHGIHLKNIRMIINAGGILKIFPRWMKEMKTGRILL